MFKIKFLQEYHGFYNQNALVFIIAPNDYTILVDIDFSAF